MSETSAIVRQVLAGTDRELVMMAADGVLPVPMAELVPLQIQLVRNADHEIAARARGALRTIPSRLVANYVRDEAPKAVLSYFALEVDEPTVLEAILQRRDVPRPLLKAVAESLSPDLQEILLLRQDAIVEEPKILEALERNPRVSVFTRRRIAEYREHLLPVDRSKKKRVASKPPPEASEEEVKEAIEKVRDSTSVEGEVENLTGLTEMQIRLLPVPVRMTLTRGASRALRGFLIRDPNIWVAVGCFHNNKFSDQEIEQICLNRNSHEDVLTAICRDRRLMAKYIVVSALVRNPRTLIGTAVKLVPRLSVRDLRDLRRDRNVPDPVRKTADRLYRIKTR